jgi:predicted XRE-type DNA-binding protein
LSKHKKSAGKHNIVRHVSEGSVLDDLGLTPEERASLAVKISIFERIQKHAKQHRYSRRDLEKILDVPQPRVSELMNGKIGKMRVETLLRYAGALGFEVCVNLRPGAGGAKKAA